jgi:DNA-binding NarL/FixJ family response regulator
LIYDERLGIRRTLTRMAEHIHSADFVDFVSEGCGLVQAYTADPADLVLINLSPATPGGTLAACRLLTKYPSAHVIVYGTASDSAAFAHAVAFGAHGFLLWTPDEWDEPSRSADPPFVPTAAGPRVSLPSNELWSDNPPTERELQVLRGITRGQTNREIGRDLFLSTDTVKTHASRLFRRLGAHDRGHAVALGMRCGLVS